MIEGMLIVDKPAGVTSHDVVDQVRRIVGIRRVGHAGTLDPFATGVLLVCTERATRLIQFLSPLEKEYLALVRLGFATETQDLTGKQIGSLESSNGLSGAIVRDVLRQFEGDQMQLPPMYSAKKVGGKRLYRSAREGEFVERNPVAIHISELSLLEESAEELRQNQDGTTDFLLRVRCSPGTYVRTIAHDIGTRLGVGAHLAMLRRTAIGHLTIDRAVTLEVLLRLKEEGRLDEAMVKPTDMLSHLPALWLDDEMTRRIENGQQIPVDDSITAAAADATARTVAAAGMALIRLCNSRSELVAVGSFDRKKQEVRPKVVMGQVKDF